MDDKFKSYGELRKVKREGKHYLRDQKDNRSKVCVMSPHGGQIECGVSELVQAVAKDKLSWYLFEGWQKAKNKKELHITSHRFDEQKCRKLLKTHDFVLAIHGEKGGKARTYVGGMNKKAARLIREQLRAAKFDAPKQIPPGLSGKDSMNICNRCTKHHGVQLEITRAQREEFFKGDLKDPDSRKQTTLAFAKYVSAVRTALNEIQKEID
jgi:phage replication-related protein YjqB (UPF0714/DUF867 family)